MRRLLIAAVGLVWVVGAGCTAPRMNAGGRNSDAEVAQLSSTGMLAYDSGELEQAATMFERALTRARAKDSAGDIADSAYNLGLCEVSLGKEAQAVNHLREADYDARARVRTGATSSCWRRTRCTAWEGTMLRASSWGRSTVRGKRFPAGRTRWFWMGRFGFMRRIFRRRRRTFAGWRTWERGARVGFRSRCGGIWRI